MATYRIETNKGNFSGPWKKIVAWQEEVQGASASIVILLRGTRAHKLEADVADLDLAGGDAEKEVWLRAYNVQIDHSGGQGHNWKDCRPCDVDHWEELEASLIEEKNQDNWVSSGGVHYRWEV